jgi:LmbE family N-acetylglucosaminyl deacetylase
LAVGAHPDDVELLCGGTLAKCAERGDQVFIAAATAAMLLRHASQDEWLRGLHDDVDGIEQLMTAQTRHRELEAGCRYAEVFSELKTYPRTGSSSLLS